MGDRALIHPPSRRRIPPVPRRAAAVAAALEAPERHHAAVELSVVVPAFNEARYLEETIDELDVLLREVLTAPFEIIVVDDGSDDDTFEVAWRVSERVASCRVVSYATNAGKGYALQRGFRSARGRIVTFFDADSEIAPSNLLQQLALLERSGASAVVGLKSGPDRRPWQRRLLTWGIRWLSRRLFRLPIRDSQTGLKTFVRSHALPVVEQCRQRGYLFDLELLTRLHRQQRTVQEMPVTVVSRRSGRITLWTGLGHLGEVGRLWFALGRERNRHGRRPLALSAALVHTREESNP